MIIRNDRLKSEKLKPNIESEDLYMEADIFVNDLPEVEDLDSKERLTEEEKLRREQ